MKCAGCTKSIHLSDPKISCGPDAVYHKACALCSDCGALSTGDTFAKKLICGGCLKKKTLEQAKEKAGAPAAAPTPAPAPAPAPQKLVRAPTEGAAARLGLAREAAVKCPECAKVVYGMEPKVTLDATTAYHMACFKCHGVRATPGRAGKGDSRHCAPFSSRLTPPSPLSHSRSAGCRSRSRTGRPWMGSRTTRRAS